jgi:hypothetical protein
MAGGSSIAPAPGHGAGRRRPDQDAQIARPPAGPSEGKCVMGDKGKKDKDKTEKQKKKKKNDTDQKKKDRQPKPVG